MSNLNETGCFTFTWAIENFIRFGRLHEEPLHSPVFKTEDNAWWQLSARNFSNDIFIFELCCMEKPLAYQLDRCEMFLISSCGQIPLKKCEKPVMSGKFSFEIFEDKRKSILPDDTLTLRCEMRRKYAIGTGESRLHSILHAVYYTWKIPGNDYPTSSYLKENNMLFNMELTYNRYNIPIFVLKGFLGIDGWFSFVYCELSHSNNKFEICDGDYGNMRTSFTKDIGNIKRYLYGSNTMGNLHLRLIVMLHTCRPEHSLPKSAKDENISEKIAMTPSKFKDDLLPHHDEILNIKGKHFPDHSGILAAKSSCGTLSADLLQLYRKDLHTDTTLKTEDRSFSAHRGILAARSSVFEAMFEKEQMAEADLGVVDIVDIDSETVDRMLVFLYADQLEVLTWEQASKLYYASDKYAVLPLKQKCLDILKAGLSVSNVCEALVLADMHSDQELMTCTVNFIRSNDEVVISSPEWEQLEEDNPRLMVKVMRQVYAKEGKK